jgi:adenylate cyclase class 2
MPLEIEKKFRLTIEQRETLPQRLRAIGATLRGEEFEENTLFSGAALELGNRILRLRKIGKRAVLTFKERLPSSSGTKRQQEDETEVVDGEAMRSILERLGFVPVLVYEKRRETWLMTGVEIVLDELPFGLFMEIEGDEAGIDEVERRLEMHLDVEHSTYPQLTLKYGEPNGQLIEARFSGRKSKN